MDKKKLALDADNFDRMELKAFLLGQIDAAIHNAMVVCATNPDEKVILKNQGIFEFARFTKSLVGNPLNFYKEQSTGESRKGSGD